MPDATHTVPQPQDLVGEVLVDATTVYAVADRMVAEADRIWASPTSSWRLLSTTHGVVNEATSVSGAFAASGVELTRASAIVDASADALFALLASPAGYQLIDPYTNASDHEKPPLEAFDGGPWRSSGGPAQHELTKRRRRLEVADASTKVPLLSAREFIVLNAIDYDTRYFLSKSVQHRGSPGTSIYPPDGEVYVGPENGTVRALNTFGVQIEPHAENPERQCVVKLLNYAHLGGRVPAVASNLFNKQFLVAMVQRMRTAMAGQSTLDAKSQSLDATAGVLY